MFTLVTRGILFDISFLILNFHVFLKLGTLLTEEELFKYLFVQHLLNLVFKFIKQEIQLGLNLNESKALSMRNKIQESGDCLTQFNQIYEGGS